MTAIKSLEIHSSCVILYNLKIRSENNFHFFFKNPQLFSVCLLFTITSIGRLCLLDFFTVSPISQSVNAPLWTSSFQALWAQTGIFANMQL